MTDLEIARIVAETKNLNRRTMLHAFQMFGIAIAVVAGISTVAISAWELATRSVGG